VSAADDNFCWTGSPWLKSKDRNNFPSCFSLLWAWFWPQFQKQHRSVCFCLCLQPREFLHWSNHFLLLPILCKLCIRLQRAPHRSDCTEHQTCYSSKSPTLAGVVQKALVVLFKSTAIKHFSAWKNHVDTVFPQWRTALQSCSTSTFDLHSLCFFSPSPFPLNHNCFLSIKADAAHLELPNAMKMTTGVD